MTIPRPQLSPDNSMSHGPHVATRMGAPSYQLDHVPFNSYNRIRFGEFPKREDEETSSSSR